MRTANCSTLALLVGCVGFSGPALGTECNLVSTFEDAVNATMESAALVFVGNATNRTLLDLGPRDEAAELKMRGDQWIHYSDEIQIEFVVSRVFKGEPVDRVLVRTAQGELVGAENGQDFIVFAFRNSYDGALHTGICSLSVGKRSEQRFAQVLGLLEEWSRTAR